MTLIWFKCLQAQKCRNFIWYDEEFPDRAKQVIRDFMVEVERLRELNRRRNVWEMRSYEERSYNIDDELKMKVNGLEMEVKTLKMQMCNIKNDNNKYLKVMYVLKVLLVLSWVFYLAMVVNNLFSKKIGNQYPELK